MTGRVEKWGRTFQDAVKAELGVNDEVKVSKMQLCRGDAP